MPDPWKGYRRKWNFDHPRSALKAHLKYRYGLAIEDYEAMNDLQEGRCAICRNKEEKRDRLSVDHDHITGAVRGLLCGTCNTALGSMKDDPEIFERAAKYLRGEPCI